MLRTSIILRSLIIFLPAMCLYSCGSETEIQEETISNVSVEDENIDDRELEALGAVKSANLQCYSGTIGESKIYLEYTESYLDEDCKSLNGFYFYESNDIGFLLEGKQCGNTIELNRLKNGEVRETFSWNVNSEEGTWKKTGKEEQVLELTRKNTISNPETFIETCLSIEDQYSINTNTNTGIDFYQLEQLYATPTSIEADDHFEGYFCGNKIYLNGEYQEGKRTKETKIIYTHIFYADHDLDMVARFHVMNWSYTGEYDENDPNFQIEEEQTFDICLALYELKKGNAQLIDKIELDGYGSANIFYFNDKAIVDTGRSKLIYSFSASDKTFKER